MEPEDLKLRTKQFALDVIRLVESLPPAQTTNVLGRQLLRSGTSVAANYHAACRMGTAEEEADDESILWIEILSEAQKVRPQAVAALLREADELVAIAIASINTARRLHAKAASAAAKVRTPHSAFRTPRA